MADAGSHVEDLSHGGRTIEALPLLRVMSGSELNAGVDAGMMTAHVDYVGEDGHVQVHMLLNRVSPWLDVSSWLPYEGKVVMVNKSAQSVSVRVPRWVKDADLKLSVNGGEATGRRLGSYLAVEPLGPGDVITMTFPVPSQTRNYRIEGSIEDARWESKEYRCTFRGNTLVDIEPRDEELERDHRYIWDPGAYGTIPIYRRDHLKADRAPMSKVSRYVADRAPGW